MTALNLLLKSNGSHLFMYLNSKIYKLIYLIPHYNIYLHGFHFIIILKISTSIFFMIGKTQVIGEFGVNFEIFICKSISLKFIQK